MRWRYSVVDAENAVENGDLDTLKRIVLRHLKDFQLPDTNGITLLYKASRRGRVEMVQLLIQHDAAIDQKSNGWTALHIASHLGYANVAKCLLENGAIVDIVNSEGQRALELTSDEETIFVLTIYTKKKFDCIVAQVVQDGAASVEQLTTIAQNMTDVCDLRIVFTITNILRVCGQIEREQLLRVLGIAFQQVINNGLIVDNDSFVFVKFVLKECHKRNWLGERNYRLWKVRIEKYVPWASEIRKQLRQHNHRLAQSETRLQTLQTNFKGLVEVYRHIDTKVQFLAQNMNSMRCALILEKQREEHVAKQKRMISFISIAVSFLVGNAFNKAVDHVIDLANPSKLLSALLDEKYTKMLKEPDWSGVVLQPAVQAVLEQACIKEEDFTEMLRMSIVYEQPELVLDDTRSEIEATSTQQWLVRTQESPSEIEAAIETINASVRERAAMVTTLSFPDVVRRITQLKLSESQGNNGIKENEDNKTVDADQEASTERSHLTENEFNAFSNEDGDATTNPLEVTFLDDLNEFVYHNVVKSFKGNVDKFRVLATRSGQDGEDINAKARVQLSDGRRESWTVLEFAVFMGYVDLVNELLDRKDIQTSQKHGVLLIKAMKQQRLRESSS